MQNSPCNPKRDVPIIRPTKEETMFDLNKYLYKKRLDRKQFGKMCKISQPTVRRLGIGPVSRTVAEKVSSATGYSVKSIMTP